MTGMNGEKYMEGVFNVHFDDISIQLLKVTQIMDVLIRGSIIQCQLEEHSEGNG